MMMIIIKIYQITNRFFTFSRPQDACIKHDGENDIDNLHTRQHTLVPLLIFYLSNEEERT